MKACFASGLILFFATSHYALASSDLNCVLKQRGATESTVKMIDDPKGFKYDASVESVTATVSYYFDTASDKKFIERMDLTDTQTGVRTFFGHNVDCTHNECPTERLVDIQTGWQQLDLGSRGIFQIWCTLSSR